MKICYSVRKYVCWFFLALLLAYPVSVEAIELETIPGQSKASFQGYSTVHDFTGTANQVHGYVQELKNWNFHSFSRQPKAYFYIGSDSLTTHNNSRDEEMYELLQTNKYNRIEYKLNKVTDVQSHGDSFTLNTRGEMAVAGETRAIQTRIKGHRYGDTVTLRTSFPLKMTDFGITPPSFMWVVQTEDQVDVSISLVMRIRETKGHNKTGDSK